MLHNLSYNTIGPTNRECRLPPSLPSLANPSRVAGRMIGKIDSKASIEMALHNTSPVDPRFTIQQESVTPSEPVDKANIRKLLNQNSQQFLKQEKSQIDLFKRAQNI